MKDHKYYRLAYSAHCFTSFDPDKRAEAYCSDFESDIKKLKSLSVPDDKILKYENLWVKWMAAKSRCISSMIVGPANFPVRRAEKYNNWERSASDECLNYFNKLVSYAEKEAFYEKNPLSRPVMAGDKDALTKLNEKMAVANNSIEVRRIKGRINEIEKRKEQGNQEIDLVGVKIVQNSDDMRLQLFFDEKPNAEIIALLKSNAFKWAPSKSAWQRQLTNNAIYSFKNFVLPEIKKMGV